MKSPSQDPSNRRKSASSEVSLAPPAQSNSPRQPPLRLDFAWALGTVALTCLALIPMLRLWRADLHAPFSYHHDALFYLMVTKDVLKHGWWLENPDLGAPFGQQLYDFPVLVGDSLHLALLRAVNVLGDCRSRTVIRALCSRELRSRER